MRNKITIILSDSQKYDRETAFIMLGALTICGAVAALCWGYLLPQVFTK